MEFVEEKLVRYNKQMKDVNKERLDNVERLSESVFRKLHKIKEISNERVVLDIALSLNDDIKNVKNIASSLSRCKKDLNIIDEDEFNDLQEHIATSSEQQIFWEICNERRELYDDLIEQTQIMPWKKTWDYCDCKGLFDMTIAEIAKAVKKDVQEMYPDIRWSVTSKKAYFYMDESINIKVLRIPRKYVEGPRHDEYQVKREVLNELFKYREEFAPRCHMYIEYHWLQEDQILDGWDFMIERTPKWSEANINHEDFITKKEEKTNWKMVALFYVCGSSLLALVNFICMFYL